MGLFRRSARQARPTDVLPAHVDPATQVGAAQLGRDAGPGMVARHNAFTDPDAGGRVALVHEYEVDGGAVLDAVRIPESWYADRPLYGGVAAFPHFSEFVAEPGNTGGHQVITGRLPFVIGDVQVQAESLAETSYREPPRPDVCRAVPRISA